MAGWLYLTMVFGPGAFLLLRWQFWNKEPGRDALVVTLCWTYFILLAQHSSREELSRDHDEACKQLEKFLRVKDPTIVEDPDLVEEWDACYRHTKEYLEAAADYEADQ